jgi:hypothetical protein
MTRITKAIAAIIAAISIPDIFTISYLSFKILNLGYH